MRGGITRDTGCTTLLPLDVTIASTVVLFVLAMACAQAALPTLVFRQIVTHHLCTEKGKTTFSAPEGGGKRYKARGGVRLENWSQSDGWEASGEEKERCVEPHHGCRIGRRDPGLERFVERCRKKLRKALFFVHAWR